VNNALTGVSYTVTSEFEGTEHLTFTSSTTRKPRVGGNTSATATQTAHHGPGIRRHAVVSAPAPKPITESNAPRTAHRDSLTPADASANDALDTYNVTFECWAGSLVSGREPIPGSAAP